MAICKWCEEEYEETESDSIEPKLFCSQEHEDYFYTNEAAIYEEEEEEFENEDD